MRILVTGGAGFIGSNFIHYMLKKYEDIEIVNFDKLTYAGNLENLRKAETDTRYRFIRGDIAEARHASAAMEGIDIVVNFAAESHNDRAVLDPGLFLKTNVIGVQILCEAALRAGVKRFHHISTCEVFGDLSLEDERAFCEDDPFCPRTPYNASKAAGNHVAMSYFHTYGLPVTISHCSNNYGPYQFPEKVIPLFVTNALEDRPLPLFKSSGNRREWIHVDDHAAGIDAILQKGIPGHSYNIGTGIEKSIEDIADTILAHLGKPAELKQYVPDRLGHDRRYLLDRKKTEAELGWSPRIEFDGGMRDTINWYVENPEWWQAIRSGAYRKYYDMYYGERIGKV